MQLYICNALKCILVILLVLILQSELKQRDFNEKILTQPERYR